MLAGQRLAFGQEEEAWVLEDAAAPVLCARSAAGVWQDADDDGLLTLPSSEQPEVVIYGDEHGRWLVEQATA